MSPGAHQRARARRLGPGRRCRLLLRRARRPLATMRTGVGRLRPLLGRGSLPVVALTSASIVAGVAEAGVLVLVANIAAAMVLHSHHGSAALGAAGWHLPIREALVVALALCLVRLVLQLIVAWLPARISAEVQGRLRRDLFDAFTRSSWAVQANEAEGHLQELMTGQLNQATQAVINVANAISAAAMFLALLIFAFTLSPLAAVVVLGCAIFLFEGLRPIDRRGRRAARDLSQATMDHAAGVSESVRLAEEAQVFGAGPAHRQRVGALIEVVSGAYFRYQLTARVVQSVYQSLVILLIVGGLGALYVLGAGQLASLGAVVLILVRASAYAQQFQAANHALIQTLPYLDRLEGAVCEYRSSAATDDGGPLPAILTLALDRVDFAYRRGEPVLHDVSFSVEAGEAVGVIGPTGAGKSTLIQLLLRLRDPDGGAYLINGEPAGAFARSDWQRRVAYIPQDPRVFHGTIGDNIRYYRDVDDAAVERVAHLANIHEEIAAMPAGYDTVIGQRADAVSGGQRQRICLARALVGQPDMLVLDEPTSALDLTSEAAVQASLADLRGRVTLFIVAHRLPILAICGRVLVLEDGRVKAFAPVSELARSDAFYRRVRGLVARSA